MDEQLGGWIMAYIPGGANNESVFGVFRISCFFCQTLQMA